MAPLSAYRALSRHRKVTAGENLALYQRRSFVVSPFPAPPSARDLLHRQPCAGPAGCFSAQLLWQRLGGVGNSEQQVFVWSAHRAPDPARGPLRENHSRRQHWRDRAPWKRYSKCVVNVNAASCLPMSGLEVLLNFSVGGIGAGHCNPHQQGHCQTTLMTLSHKCAN